MVIKTTTVFQIPARLTSSFAAAQTGLSKPTLKPPTRTPLTSSALRLRFQARPWQLEQGAAAGLTSFNATVQIGANRPISNPLTLTRCVLAYQWGYPAIPSLSGPTKNEAVPRV